MYLSTISTVALLIEEALARHGCDSQELFRSAGLDPDKLRDPNARYPVYSMLQLWKMAVEATGNPCIGLEVGRLWHPTSMHALGYSWMASPTLKDAFERVVRYIPLVTTAAVVELNELPDQYRFVVSGKNGMSSAEKEALLRIDEPIDAFMTIVVKMCRISYGRDFHPLKVVLKREKPRCAREYLQFFCAPVQFSALENALYLSRKALNKALPAANADLARANDQVITEYLARLDRTNITMQVRARLIELLPIGEVSEETIAAAINISHRSLQRKLKEEGTTYKQLLEDMRRELAANYMKNSHLSINEITYLLGFSAPSNFSRAFKRWMGVSPSEYRYFATDNTQAHKDVA